MAQAPPPRVTDSIIFTHMVRKPSRSAKDASTPAATAAAATNSTSKDKDSHQNHNSTATSRHLYHIQQQQHQHKHEQQQPTHQHVDIVLQSRSAKDADDRAKIEREEQAKKDQLFLQRIGANPTFPVHLDYSFRDLKRLDDLASEQARQPPVQATRDMNNLYEHVTGIRLNNNQLESLDHMYRAFGRILARPMELTYMDLSFNRIRQLDKTILEFRELAHLNLHGNKIDSWDSLEQLGKLTQLKQLTLHGNLLDQSAQARYMDTAIGLFPSIEKMDFTLVTREDRERSGLWIHTWRKARRRQHQQQRKMTATSIAGNNAAAAAAAATAEG